MASSPPDPEPIPPRDDTQPLPVAPVAADAPAEVPVAPAARLPAAAIVAMAGVGLLFLVLVVGVVVNASVARNAEERASVAASEALGSPATVRLSGFPIGLRLLVGSPVDAVMVARDVPITGSSAVLTRLEVTAAEVTLDRSGAGAVLADRATFVAELDDDGVRQLVGIVGRIPLTNIELANGVARLSIAGFALVDATASVEGGRVVFRITAPIANLVDVPLAIDELPLGFVAEDVEIRRGVLRLRGSARDLRLEAPETIAPEA